MKKVYKFIALLFCIIFMQCSTPNNTSDVQPEITPIEATALFSKDEVAQDFGQKLVGLLKQPEVREFFKQEALNKFDGDYDILLQKVLHKEISITQKNGIKESVKLSDLLFSSSKNSRTNEASPTELSGEIYPLLQVSVPWREVNAEIVTWNEDTYGDRMKYVWIEEDNGDPIEVSFSLSTTYKNKDAPDLTLTSQVKSTITQKDFIITQSIVEYCDNADGYEYGSGSYGQFVVRKKD